jgi:hypothetical protein
VWAATSRVRHLSKGGALPNTHVPKSFQINLQSTPINQLGFVPFDHSLTFVPLFVFNHVPTCSFIFAFADFY